MGATICMAVRFRLHTVLAERQPPISQSRLSRLSGVSMTTINAMVHQKTAQVSLKTLDAICRALDIQPGELLERDDSIAPTDTETGV